MRSGTERAPLDLQTSRGGYWYKIRSCHDSRLKRINKFVSLTCTLQPSIFNLFLPARMFFIQKVTKQKL